MISVTLCVNKFGVNEDFYNDYQKRQYNILQIEEYQYRTIWVYEQRLTRGK